MGNKSKMRYVRVGFAWCTSGAGARRCTSPKVGACFVRVWAQICFKHA